MAVNIRALLRSTVVRRSAIALGAGLLMGVVYWAIHVQSPAPPPIALIGLLGMVAGESVAGLVRRLLARRRARRKAVR
jgi:XapX domain-containing protein